MAFLCLVSSLAKPFTVEDHPEGYPMLAAFQSNDPAFSIYRNFEYLHSRVLLDLQFALSETLLLAD